jgi:hypothetical protein
VYRVFLVLIVLLCSCPNPLTEEDIRIQEYGELYFTLDCWWPSQPNISSALFWCQDDVETDLISGFVSLAIQEDLDGEQFLSICGRDVILNSGNNLHDTLILGLTQNNYDCINSYERSLGNEFDWIWDDETRTLQLIWRPDDDIDKVLTLFVEEKGDSAPVLGSVYYKIGDFD